MSKSFSFIYKWANYYYKFLFPHLQNSFILKQYMIDPTPSYNMGPPCIPIVIVDQQLQERDQILSP